MYQAEAYTAFKSKFKNKTDNINREIFYIIERDCKNNWQLVKNKMMPAQDSN